VLGVVGRRELEEMTATRTRRMTAVGEVMRAPVVVFADETLRSVADRMVAAGVGLLPVVDREDPRRLLGLVSQCDLLRARERLLTEERHRERVMRPRLVPRLLPGLVRRRRAERA
jgi:predicted transcriptional regulator